MINIEIKLQRNPVGRTARPKLLVAGVALAMAVPVLALAAPVTIPHQFMDGGVISAEEFNENFDAIASAVNDNDTRVAALEDAPPKTVTIRKATATTSRSTAIAFCEDDEILTGGGCFLPPENHYDPDFADYATYYTGNFPRPMVGLTSVPVAAGTEPADIRPTANIGGDIIPFPGDIIAEDEGSVVAEPGGGWACRPGIIDLDNAGGAQAVATNLYENWFFYVKAYAVCTSI